MSGEGDTFVHLLAGGLGGTAGAILTCPLEVVKTRLQSSNSGFDTSVPVKDGRAPYSGKTMPNASGQLHCTVKQPCSRVANNNATARVMFANLAKLPNVLACHAAVFARPPEPAATQLLSRTSFYCLSEQVRNMHAGLASAPDPRKPMGVWSCLKHIWATEGPRGLFRGLGPNLVGVAPSRAIYFWCYSTTKRNVNRSIPKMNRDTPFVHVISAASAGFFSSCVTNPIWLVKTRLQLDRAGGSVFGVVSKIYTTSGITGFWKGVTASWWGISETVIHFVIYEFLKKKITDYKEKNNTNGKTLIDFGGFMICGATSKTCATCVAYPHEVARTRMREAGLKYKSFWQTLFLVHREEGRRGLYRGLGTQLLRQIPNTAVMMATYELTVYVLTKYRRKANAKRRDNASEAATSKIQDA